MSTVTWLRKEVARAPARPRPRLRDRVRAPHPGHAPLVAILLAFVLMIAAVAIAATSGPGEVPPATGAASLVPGDALAYIHLSTDSSRPAVRRSLTLGRQLSALSGPVLSRLEAVVSGGATVDFQSQIRPWLGKEAALAILDTDGSSAGSLIVLDVRNRVRAAAFLDGAGAAPVGAYRGHSLYAYRTGTELAFVRHYLVLGQDPSVRASIDVAARSAPSLAASGTYRSAAAGEPDDRVLDGYVSADGVTRVMAPRGGVLSALAALLEQPSLTGASFSVSAIAGGARVRIHSSFDPTLARVSGRHPAPLRPTLQNLIPSGASLLLDVRDLARSAPRVLRSLASIGVASRVGPLLQRLGAALTSEGVDVKGVLSLFSGESAVAVAPHAGRPTLIVVSRVRDQAAAQQTLASLEVPLAALFPPPANGPGQAPVLGDVQVAGVTVHQLALAPGLRLDYGVFRGLVVVSTGLGGIAGVAQRARSLADDPGFKATLQHRPAKVTSLVFLDFSQLLSLGEQTGLLGSARFTALAPDLRRIRAAGLSTTSGETDTTAELFLQIP